MANNRFDYVIKNSLSSLLFRVMHIVISFAMRTAFIRLLGNEYTGVSSLFTDILTVLSLVELGFDSSMAFSLYKPLAEKDERHVAALMNFYRKAFIIIGCSVFVMGLACIPLLPVFVKKVPDIREDIRLLFMMYVVTSASSYFFIFKTILIRADQKGYIIYWVSTAISVLECVLELIFLFVTRNFFSYLIIRLISTITLNLINSHFAEKLYPHYLHNRSAVLESHERKKLYHDIFALLVYNLAAVILSSTDSIFISAFVGTAEIAIIGNFTLIINSLKNLIKMVISATRPSVGNLVATDKIGRQRIMFNHINFLTFWIALVCSTLLFVLLNPFIGRIWFSSQYMISTSIVFLIVINFYMSIMSMTIGTFRSSNGLFVQGWYRPAIMSLMNIVLDYLLGKKWGIIGIYFATSFSMLTTQVWYDPYVVFKHAFHEKPWKYYALYVAYFALLLASFGIVQFLSDKFSLQNAWLDFFCRLIIAFVIPNLIVIVIFRNSDDFKYALGIFARLFMKALRRIKAH